MKLRLHMVKAQANYGGGTCRKCNGMEETTEHVLECMLDGRLETSEQMLNGRLETWKEMVEDISWLKKTCGIVEQFETLYG